MSDLAQIARNLQTLYLTEVLERVVNEAEPLILEMLRKQHTVQGLSGTGRDIGTYKSDRYARMKNRQNPTVGRGRVDLELSGRYHERLNARQQRLGVMEIESGVDYEKYLTKRYGAKINRLTRENINEIIEKNIRPKFFKAVQNRIFR